MKILQSVLAAALIALAGAVAAAEPLATVPVKVVKKNKDNYPTRVETDGGISVETMDGKASFTIDGRLQFDTLFYDGVYNETAGGAGASDTRVRRMRLGLGGDLDPDWEWYFSLDVNNDSGRATLDNFTLIYKGFEYADVAGGRFKRPFFLEALTSSKWITMVERSLTFDVIRSHAVDFGLQFSKLYETEGWGPMSWYLMTANEGVEDYAGAQTPAGRDQWQYWARGAWAPWAGKGKVLHFGLGLGDINPAAGSTIDITTRLGITAATPVGVTYIVDNDREAGLETAFVWGPVSAQAEYVLRMLDLTGGGSADVSGYYALATWTVTGESRQYKPYPARMDKVAPSGEHKFGAVELVARYDDVELEQPGLAAAAADTISFGANWYATSHLHFKLNYLMTHADNFGTVLTDGDGISFRTAFVF